MDWRGFELHPETPPGGVPVSRFFPSDQLRETQQYLTDFAEKHGVEGMRVSGHVPNVVFPCATLCDSETGRIAMYYGAADTSTCVAYTEMDALVDFIKANSEVF